MKKLFASTILAAVALPLTFAAQTPAPATTPNTKPPVKSTAKVKKHHHKVSKTVKPAQAAPAQPAK